MKKILLLIMIVCFALSAAGCAQKKPETVNETPEESGPPTITASASTETAEEDTASPSAEAVTPSTEPSEAVSQAPGTEPSPEVSQSPEEEPSAAPSTEPKDYLELGFGLMETDGMGSVKIDLSESELIALLGEPDSKTEPLVWGADGMEHCDWIYEAQGLELGMWKEPESSAEAGIFSIRAVSACTLETQRGIKIGDTQEDVETAYADEINEEDSSLVDNGIVAGSVYGGMIFHFEDGKVASIFIGAAAE